MSWDPISPLCLREIAPQSSMLAWNGRVRVCRGQLLAGTYVKPGRDHEA